MTRLQGVEMDCSKCLSQYIFKIREQANIIDELKAQQEIFKLELQCKDREIWKLQNGL